MRATLTVLVILVALMATGAEKPATTPAKPTAQNPSTHLPVKRVVLYKNGVGYFEHAGRVRGNEDLTIDFTTAQLNDVLKSLTVVDLGEGKATAVRYNSIAPLEERLRALRLPLNAEVTRAQFLDALRGARIEVRSGTSTATGKLLSVETKRKRLPRSDETIETTEFSLVTDGGEMRSFELGPGVTVRVAERDLNDEVGRYLNLIGSARAKDVRRMVVSTAGAGERDVLVSYISEVPVWKSTYRIILSADAKAKPIIQGWAIVDNTVGEDWNNVELSLVAGAPQSFVQDISTPFYVRRPVIELPQSALLSPQTHEATMLRMPTSIPQAPALPPPPGTNLRGTVTDQTGATIPGARVTLRNEETGESQTTTTNSAGVYEFRSVRPGNSALIVEASGFQRTVHSNFYLGVGRTNEINTTLNVGATSTAVEVTAEAPALNTMSTMLSSMEPEAEGEELGDLFSYNIKQKITIGKDQSALVPILQSRIDADKVTLWSQGNPHALRTLWINNNSGLTLDAGTFNVVEGNTFAGEGLLATVKPGERRLISYAADTAVRVSTGKKAKASDADEDDEDDEGADQQTLTRVHVVKGSMLLTVEKRREVTYTIRNADNAPRDVIIEHPAQAQWKLVSQAKPEETTTSFHRFRVKVGPDATEQLVVSEARPEQETFVLTTMPTDVLELVSGKKISPELRAALQRLSAKSHEVSGYGDQIRKHEQEINAISTDQARVRENMKALKGSAEEKTLLQRYAQQLNSQEDRIAELKKMIADLNKQQQAARAELEKMAMELKFDETL